jgi:hypothetical protein
MVELIQLNWAEQRRMGDRFELHFVEATETESEWKFQDCGAFGVRRCDAQLSARLVQVAEFGKRAVLSGQFANIPDLHLKRVGFGDSTKLSLAPREVPLALDMVLAIVRYYRYRWQNTQQVFGSGGVVVLDQERVNSNGSETV